MGGLFGPTVIEYAHKSFNVEIKFPNTCLVSGDMSTPCDPSVLKGDYHHVFACSFVLVFLICVLLPKDILMKLQ